MVQEKPTVRGPLPPGVKLEENIYVAMSFFRRILRPTDRAFLVAFGNRIRLIRASTNTIEELDWQQGVLHVNFIPHPLVWQEEIYPIFLMLVDNKDAFRTKVI